MGRSNNYSNDKDSKENLNADDRYSVTGESEFSRDHTVPLDSDEVFSERHYVFDNPLIRGREKIISNKSKTDFSKRENVPRNYRRSDHLIQEDVCESLYRSSLVDASEIEVKVKNGIVHLFGFVETREQKKLAEECAENLAGVDDIYNELHIKKKGENVPLGKHGLMNNITGMN